MNNTVQSQFESTSVNEDTESLRQRLSKVLEYKSVLKFCIEMHLAVFVHLLLIYLHGIHEFYWSITILPLLLYSLKECTRYFLLWRASSTSEDKSIQIQSLANWITLIVYEVL